MCTRFVLLQEHLDAILKRLGLKGDTGFVSRYNIAPGSLIPAVRTKPPALSAPTGRAPRPESVALHWGLVPSWAKRDERAVLVNARALRAHAQIYNPPKDRALVSRPSAA